MASVTPEPKIKTYRILIVVLALGVVVSSSVAVGLYLQQTSTLDREINRSSQLNDEISSLSQRINTLNSQLSQRQAQIQQLETERTQLQDQMQQRGEENSQLQEQLNLVNNQITQLEGEITELEIQIMTLSETNVIGVFDWRNDCLIECTYVAELSYANLGTAMANNVFVTFTYYSGFDSTGMVLCTVDHLLGNVDGRSIGITSEIRCAGTSSTQARSATANLNWS